MKIGLFEIIREPYRFAKLEWWLFKTFGIKRTIPCGRGKHDKYMCCCQPFTSEYCNVINEENKHEIICKVCGSSRMISSQVIENNDESWIEF